MKKTLSLVLALVMVLGSFSAAFAAESVTTGAEAGAFLKAAGVLVGDENGDLNLGDNLSRQDAVILVAQLRGEIKAAQAFEGTATYEDVEIKFYNAPLAWAQENGLFVGHSEKVFGFNEDLTAQEYAKVLLTALGYKVAPNGDSDIKWAEVLTKAEEFGILKNLKVENATEITRGEMALMTFNALGVNMKGSKKTLAETLGIEMPAPDVLKVESVKTENLKEIVLELSNAKLVNEEKLEEANNYKLTGHVVKKAEVIGNEVVLLLKGELVKGREFELVVRNIAKDVNGKYKFTAQDNTIPAVEKVEVLGEYGIKVTTTEPIKNVKERNFLIDGKNVAMEIEQYGRDIVLTPYYKASFSEKAETLTIRELEDFAGYKSVEKDFVIEIVKDEVAPKVTDVVAKGDAVEVTFDKDIYNDSIVAYEGRKDLGNASYEEGRHTVYATKAEKVDTNKVVYTFEKELPRRTMITIVDVENHSKVKMEKTTEEARLVLDYSEPEIIDSKVTANAKDGSATIKLYFDKDVRGEFEVGSSTNFDVDKHFAVYEREVNGRSLLRNKLVSATYDGTREDVVVVKVEDLAVYEKAQDNEYVLEVEGFTDTSSLKNKMYRDYVDFKITSKSVFKVENVKVLAGRNDTTEVTIYFSRPVDRRLAEELNNYIFTTTDGTRKDVNDLKGDIVAETNGEEVTIILSNKEFEIGTGAKQFGTLRILDILKDKDENRLQEAVVYNFNNRSLTTSDYELVKTADKAYDVIVSANATEITLKSNEEATYTVRPIAGTVKTLEKLTIDAPKAHVVIDTNLTVDLSDIKAISVNSLEINGSVGKVVINTNKEFSIFGNVTGLELESNVSGAKVKVGTTKAGAKAIELEKNKEVKIDASGEVAVNTDKLVLAIDNANDVDVAATSTDGKDIDSNEKWTTVEVKTAFLDAKIAATAVKNKADATQAEVDKAVKALEDAVKVYNNAKKYGTQVVVSEEAKEEKAEAAVVEAESKKTDETRTAAQELVRALKDGRVKTDLQARLDKIVTAEDLVDADQKAVDKALESVKDSYEVAEETEEGKEAAAAELLVKADVNNEEITVAVTEEEGKFTVTLTKGEATATKVITVTVAVAEGEETYPKVTVGGETVAIKSGNIIDVEYVLNSMMEEVVVEFKEKLEITKVSVGKSGGGAQKVIEGLQESIISELAGFNIDLEVQKDGSIFVVNSTKVITDELVKKYGDVVKITLTGGTTFTINLIEA